MSLWYFVHSIILSQWTFQVVYDSFSDLPLKHSANFRFPISKPYCVPLCLYIYVCNHSFMWEERFAIRENLLIQKLEWQKKGEDKNWKSESRLEKLLKYCTDKLEKEGSSLFILLAQPQWRGKRRYRKSEERWTGWINQWTQAVLSYHFLLCLHCQQHLNNTSHSFLIINEIREKYITNTPPAKFSNE